MWSEFEWENKVAVRTTIDSLQGYLEHLLKTTNMRCLTPASALEGDCDFLAANMYARSVFGEDALANLSIDKTNGVVSGHIRIRSKTQGIALSLGDKVRAVYGLPCARVISSDGVCFLCVCVEKCVLHCDSVFLVVFVHMHVCTRASSVYGGGSVHSYVLFGKKASRLACCSLGTLSHRLRLS